MQLKERQILCIIQEPGKDAYVEPFFSNNLKQFQKTVGGHIETVTFDDFVVICDEEGRLKQYEYNTRIIGVDFYGTIVIVGYKDSDFCSLKPDVAKSIMEMLNRRIW